MSQQMNILCCFSCNIYQVHIVKTAKKWQCKICNKKQPFRRIFFQGSGKDCRVQVQKLNAMKEHESQTNSSFEMVNSICNNNQNNYIDHPKATVSENKWAKYLDTSDKDLLNAVETSNHEYVRDEAIDDSVYSHNNSSLDGYSQNSNKSSNYYQNDPEQIFSSNDETESLSFVEQEISHTMLNPKNDKSNDSYDKNTTETNEKNIFDDNEDFDLVIDF